MNSFYLAWRYIWFHKYKTLTIVLCVSLIIIVPIALDRFFTQSQQQLLSRANNTPLLFGARGSSYDLVMNSLYFVDERPELITMSAADEIISTRLALPIPLYIAFNARNFPIVGTTYDYFDYRNLEIAAGRHAGFLGECVLGAEVAEILNLKPGDTLLSSPQTVFDIAGTYPLKMKISGILKPVYTEDDRAIFVDVKTTWIMQGFGHGHEDLVKTKDSTVILNRDQDTVVANAKLFQYNEITIDNIDSFHFHGDTGVYPLTALIVIAEDAKSAALLEGRYIDPRSDYQLVRSTDVINDLLATVFRAKKLLSVVLTVVTVATVVALLLIFFLSLKLRRDEVGTIFKLGGSRLTIVKLLGAEMTIIVTTSLMISLIFIYILKAYSSNFIKLLLV